MVVKTKQYPTQKYLKECLDYNTETGVFTWKVRPLNHFKSKVLFKRWNTRYSCKIAGSEYKNCTKKYIQIVINNKHYVAHRLAWIFANCAIDRTLEIDHINGSGLDNSMLNLRLVDRLENKKNVRLQSNNKSGTSGVSFYTPRNKWRARIQVESVGIHLGYFNSYEEACDARKNAECKFKFHKNHGSVRPL